MNKVKKRVGLAEREPVNAGEREGAESVPSLEKGSNLFKPGQPPGPGRPKGVPNKINKTIKEAVLEAVQPGACHPDGFKGWLIERSQGGIEDRKIFAGVVSRVIPVEVTGTDGGAIKIDLGWLAGRKIGGGDVVDATYTTQSAGDANVIKHLEHDDTDQQSGDGADE